ncbi:MFS transporter [Paenibacillus barcinonensis]|uniref:MFS transporter n=1 Tax=Paenibacillus barcinonensis TaxID=198119 RepID=A0A2V4VDI5_PAEBA|nr:MFS transporter [Paenibacillus barcinonensis]PYE50829.1 DHA1 family quinolone resistance protein-like MFS transporter [Paenibacillus barcinonensis]QKS57501.1 MFS transporter [Paenibacillus barcinonensis]
MEVRRNLPLLLMICFLSQMGGFMILPLFPLFMEEFGLSGWTLGVIFALFYVGKVIGGVPAAALYRKLGGKRALILMLAALALCMGGFAVSKSAILFGLLRLLQGLASSGLTVVVRSIIGDGGSVENRGLYNGYISSSEGGGMILGPVISGWLAIHWPLSVPFLLVALCCLIAVVTAMGIKTSAQNLPASLPIASRTVKNDHNNQNQQKHANAPAAPTTESIQANSLPVTMTMKQQLIGYITVHVLEMSAYAVFLTYFALYATQVMQWDAFSASLAFTVAGISTFAAAPVVGRLSDRMGDRLLLCMLGMFLIGVEVLVFLSTSSHIWVYIGMFIGGIGGACYMDSFFAHIGDHTPEEQRSPVIGQIVSAAEIGSIASPLIAALLMEAGSLYTVFIFNLLLIAAAIAVQAVMRSRYRVRTKK